MGAGQNKLGAVHVVSQACTVGGDTGAMGGSPPTLSYFPPRPTSASWNCLRNKPSSQGLASEGVQLGNREQLCPSVSQTG